MKDLITDILVKQSKLTAREIAKTLGIDKKEVNSFLYQNQDIFSKDEAFCWSLAIIPSVNNLKRPMMNSELELNDIAKNKLIQLLDYVSHQAEDTQKIQYEISGNRFYSYDLEKLRGLKILNDGDWWFQIERLQLQSMPKPSEILSFHIYVDSEKEPAFNFSSLNPIVSFNKVHQFRLPYRTVARDFIIKIDIIQKLFKEFESYRNSWEHWKQDNDEIKKSIVVYDKLFSWNTAINLGGTGDGEEIVAGFGLVNWVLPTTQKSYSYPLITIPLEMEIEKNGLIRVAAKDTRANVEMDAILLEDDLPTSGQVKLALKDNLNNGRSLQLFEGETYSDLVEAFVANIFSRGIIAEAENRAIPSKNLVVTLTSVLFSRPKRNSILSDDIELLKIKLNDPSVAIPEQPLSLVTELNNNINEKETYSFRGRSGTEGFGSKVEELYFPLPYNKEQITIVQNLLIELNNRGIDEILKEFTQLIAKTQKCLDLKNKYLDVFSVNYLKVFSRKKSFDFYGLPKNIDDLIQLLGQKLKIFNLEVYQQQLADQVLYLSEFDNKISNQLTSIVSQINSDSLYENELREYADLLKQLTHLKDLAEDFDRVKSASIKLSQTNALILSKDILEIPYAQEIEDPVLRNRLVDAWEWKRLETYVMAISNTSRIENLYERRRIHEKNLSQNYAQLAANKIWLALKENASDKILVALQRYKIAVQKIGKNTGKNAPRYRKDAQQALKEATAAIPCWVMSHIKCLNLCRLN